jgi:hypothetical protein
VIGHQASRAKSHTLFRHSLKETLFSPLSPEFDSMNCENTSQLKINARIITGRSRLLLRSRVN